MSELVHLPDRLFAQTIAALQSERDRLRGLGYTGDDCQAALDVLTNGVTPSSDGIEFRIIDAKQEAVAISRVPHLGAFLKGYIEAALWADCMPFTDGMSDEDRDRAETGGGENLIPRPGAEDKMARESQMLDFIDGSENDLQTYVDILVNERGLDRAEAWEYAGHDFWLTRVGHGAGFWDRGMGELGDRLTDACKPYGSADDHTPYDCGDGTFDA